MDNPSYLVTRERFLFSDLFEDRANQELNTKNSLFLVETKFVGAHNPAHPGPHLILKQHLRKKDE